MYDLFIQLGIAFFTIEIIHRAYDLYIILTLRWAIRQHRDCEECNEQELINEIRKK